MDKVYIAPGAYYIENFVEHSDIDVLEKDFRIDSNWNGHGVFLLKDPESLSTESKEVLDKYRLKVFSLINNDEEIVRWNSNIQKYKGHDSDWAIFPHADRFDTYGIENADSDSCYVTKGYILYFNDDYVGGNVVYVNKDISIRPKKGMIIVHSGFEEYKHGVSSVTQGDRFILTGFVYEKGKTQN
jgi:hypothetical protein